MEFWKRFLLYINIKMTYISYGFFAHSCIGLERVRLVFHIQWEEELDWKQRALQGSWWRSGYHQHWKRTGRFVKLFYSFVSFSSVENCCTKGDIEIKNYGSGFSLYTQMLVSSITKERNWIGLSYIEKESVLKWVDGTPVDLGWVPKQTLNLCK